MITSLNPAVAVLVLSALANPGLRAAERTVYRGSLEGAGEIVVELQAAPAGELQGRYFYPALHQLDVVQPQAALPVSEALAGHMLCLPLYNQMGSAELRRLESAIASLPLLTGP